MQMQSKLRDGDDDGDGDSGGPLLPQDIILEVLLRLSAKDLCRFRCVSKAWCSLISDPAFVAGQSSRAGPLMVAMFGSAPEQELRLLDMAGNVLRVFDVRVRDRAILALTRLDLILVDMKHLGAMIIDPASGRDFSVIGTKDDPWPVPSTMFIMNDYSFGRAVPSGDYKLLHHHEILCGDGDEPSRRCEVATIMDCGVAKPSWRQRPFGPLDRMVFFCEDKPTVNGVLYFMPYIDFTYPNRRTIAAFNLESEEWKPETIKGPLLGLKKEEDKWYCSLTELKGTLCFVHQLKNKGGHYASIWRLMDPDMSVWVKEYMIQMPESLLSTKPLDILGDGTILLLLNKFQKAGNIKDCNRYMLQLYNSSTKAFTQVTEMAEGFSGKIAFYTGSLLS